MVSLKLEKCDVLIAMSGIYVKSLHTAKKKYNSKIFLERGSHHILSQKDIIDDMALKGMKVSKIPQFIINRELLGYDTADKIVIPASHVEVSFINNCIASEKLFINQYGVDLAMFPITNLPENMMPTAIFVGLWCYRKGVDVLVAAFAKLPHIKLIHVGPIGDAPLPLLSNFKHIDPVSQWLLKDLYSKAHIFVLASREEGLALVQVQALSCGLPIVCTDRTGGSDLKNALKEPGWISVIKHDDPIGFAREVDKMMKKIIGTSGPRDLISGQRETFSWSAYGKRYENELIKVIK